MRKLVFVFLFLLFAQQASALMAAPAKISEPRTLTITNNLHEEANYTVASGCAEIDKTEFKLNPAEKQKLKITPTCIGYLQITEEVQTAIHKLNIPIKYASAPVKLAKNKKPNWALPAAVASALTLGLVFAIRRQLKRRKGGVSLI